MTNTNSISREHFEKASAVHRWALDHWFFLWSVRVRDRGKSVIEEAYIHIFVFTNRKKQLISK